MPPRLPTIAIWLTTIAAYLARPWSCVAALQLEVRPADNPYHSIDPHGFGVLGAIAISLLLMAPVFWLLLQRRPSNTALRAPIGRVVAILASIATPILLQLTYLNMPLRWCWPIIAASVVWTLVVMALCLRTAPGSLSAHGAFDRSPLTAWTLVAAIGIGKAAVFALALT